MRTKFSCLFFPIKHPKLICVFIQHVCVQIKLLETALQYISQIIKPLWWLKAGPYLCPLPGPTYKVQIPLGPASGGLRSPLDWDKVLTTLGPWLSMTRVKLIIQGFHSDPQAIIHPLVLFKSLHNREGSKGDNPNRKSNLWRDRPHPPTPSPSEIFAQRSCNFRLQPQKLWSGKTKLLQNRRSKCSLTLWWGIYSDTFDCSMWYSWQFLSIRKVVWIWIFSPVMGSWVCALMTGKAEPTVNKMSQL